MKKLPVILMILILVACSDTGTNNIDDQNPGKIYIYEVVTEPTDLESVTIKNDTGYNFDISQWTLGDIRDPAAFVIPANTILLNDELINFGHHILGFKINNRDEIIYFKNPDGLIIDTWPVE